MAHRIDRPTLTPARHGCRNDSPGERSGGRRTIGRTTDRTSGQRVGTQTDWSAGRSAICFCHPFFLTHLIPRLCVAHFTACRKYRPGDRSGGRRTIDLIGKRGRADNVWAETERAGRLAHSAAGRWTHCSLFGGMWARAGRLAHCENHQRKAKLRKPNLHLGLRKTERTRNPHAKVRGRCCMRVNVKHTRTRRYTIKG